MRRILLATTIVGRRGHRTVRKRTRAAVCTPAVTSRRQPDGASETLVHHPRLLRPGIFSVARDGDLDVTANRMYRQPRFHGGKDLHEELTVLFCTQIDAGAVRLTERPETHGGEKTP